MITRIFDHPLVFGLSQTLIPFTVWAYEDLMRAHIRCNPGERALDIGCGVGAHRRFFAGKYTGIDINPRYIDVANRRASGDFRVMDCTALEFADTTYDLAACIATFHHLSDDQVRAAMRGALRVLRPGGMLHVIDPILPQEAGFKRWLFLRDRGEYPRTMPGIEALLSSCAPIAKRDMRSSILHNVGYFGFVKAS